MSACLHVCVCACAYVLVRVASVARTSCKNNLSVYERTSRKLRLCRLYDDYNSQCVRMYIDYSACVCVRECKKGSSCACVSVMRGSA